MIESFRRRSIRLSQQQTCTDEQTHSLFAKVGVPAELNNPEDRLQESIVRWDRW